jgi:hypothetical protein
MRRRHLGKSAARDQPHRPARTRDGETSIGHLRNIRPILVLSLARMTGDWSGLRGVRLCRRFLQSHAFPSAILLDELNAGFLKRPSDCKVVWSRQ